MGIACAATNAHACDRIGLSVVLRRPAAAITAKIRGGSFELDHPSWSGTFRDGERTRFAGFLRPAGLRKSGPDQVIRGYGADARWVADEPVFLPVELRVEDEGGNMTKTRVRLALAPGWG